ncbi:PTS sugar transporter subunit IIA [Agathobaculum sp.]|uniref:PTS sugar transporter subunit IIA n=1 Tax=Agathobaculum sp. TaxID=2048138 RepID=UPI002A7FE102|nr:PTS glucose transporter subunit IIA [Agathobaculum sp.]MDY3619240.1 PTS glucose transporter subunit IIA [Agathobaculum sp.]
MFGKLKEKLMGGGQSGIEVCAPVSGKIVALSDVPDPTFAQGILGQGAAVLPSEGRIVAPADGTIDVMFDTGHAVSMTTADGAEVLVHVGIDTVNLKGEHYKACCKAGDKVKKGDLLIEFDPAAIEAAGYQIITPVIICNTDAYSAVKAAAPGEVSAGGALLTLQK